MKKRERYWGVLHDFDEHEKHLIEQEDVILEAGIKGLALFCIAALVIIGIAFLINYVGF